MQFSTSFGYKCPNCNTKISIAIQVGKQEQNCPQCGTTMVPDKERQSLAANVYCKSCNSYYGLVTSDRCPNCGGEFSDIQS